MKTSSRILALSGVSLFCWAQHAMASSASGYVTDFKLYKSTYSSWACDFRISSTSSSTSGTRYYVPDSSTAYDASCSAAFLAQQFNDKLTVDYTSVGGYRQVSGLSSEELTGDIPYYWTQDSTGTSSADRCMVTINSSGSTRDLYVDDAGDEQIVMCAFLALLHFHGSTTWSILWHTTSKEILSVSAAY